MANRDYVSGRITIQQQKRFKELESYRIFLQEKKKIQNKYPTKPWDTRHPAGQGNYKNPYEQHWWDDWQEYKKEISDLMFQPNGAFQDFVWEICNEKDEVAMKVWLRGRYDYEAIAKERKQNK